MSGGMSSMSLGGHGGFFNPSGAAPRGGYSPFSGAPTPSRDYAAPKETPDPKELCRLPNDPPPFDMAQHFQSESHSFPSIFVPDDSDQSITQSELQHVWTRLNTLIQRALDTNSTPGDVVNMVSTFYEENVRAHFSDAPVWLEKDIYAYIYGDSFRQADAALESVNKTVEFLRNNLAEKNLKDGSVAPNEQNIKLLLSAVKTHAFLVDAKRKRDRERTG